MTPNGEDRDRPPPAPAAERAEREVRRYLRRWVPWAIIYGLGFVALWVTGLAATQAFYVWAIGWVLVWGVWAHADHVRRYLRPGRRGGSDDDESER